MRSKGFILEVVEKDKKQLFFLRDPKTGQIINVTSNVDDLKHLLDD